MSERLTLLSAIFDLKGPPVSDPDYEKRQKVRSDLRGAGEATKLRAEQKRKRRGVRRQLEFMNQAYMYDYKRGVIWGSE